MELIILNEYHCQCGKLLGKGVLLTSMLELKCRFCHRVNRFNGIDWPNGEGLNNQYFILFDALCGVRVVDAQMYVYLQLYDMINLQNLQRL